MSGRSTEVKGQENVEPGRHSGSGSKLPSIPLVCLELIGIGYHTMSENANVNGQRTYVLRLAFAVEGLQRWIQRVFLEDEEGVVAPAVPFLLFFGEAWIPRSHRIQQPLLLDEWKECDTLPSHPFTVHVDIEGARIEVDDR